MASASTPNGRPQVSPLLLAEALGFVPQLILDDITNVGNGWVMDVFDGNTQNSRTFAYRVGSNY